MGGLRCELHAGGGGERGHPGGVYSLVDDVAHLVGGKRHAGGEADRALAHHAHADANLGVVGRRLQSGVAEPDPLAADPLHAHFGVRAAGVSRRREGRVTDRGEQVVIEDVAWGPTWDTLPTVLARLAVRRSEGGPAWVHACGPVDVVDDRHVGDGVAGARRHRRAVAHRGDEGVELEVVARPARQVLDPAPSVVRTARRWPSWGTNGLSTARRPSVPRTPARISTNERENMEQCMAPVAPRGR